MIAGVVVVLFGLHLLGLTPLRLMNQEARFHVDTSGGRAAALSSSAPLRVRLDAASGRCSAPS